MASGRERHEARRQAVAALGRALSRRSRSSCELCGEGGPLQVVEVDGAPDEPDEDWAVMICTRCVDMKREQPDSLRFLEGSMWSETVPVQVYAVRRLRELASRDVEWARDALDGLWLAPEVEERLV